MAGGQEISYLKFIKHIGGILNGFQINKSTVVTARII